MEHCNVSFPPFQTSHSIGQHDLENNHNQPYGDIASEDKRMWFPAPAPVSTDQSELSISTVELSVIFSSFRLKDPLTAQPSPLR